MSLALARANEIVDLRRPQASGSSAVTTVLVDTESLTVIHMALPTGKQMSTHRAPGELTVVCVEGKVSLTAQGQTQELMAGQFVFLGDREPHSLAAITDSVVLLTIVRTKQSLTPDVVEEASQESFPASDPPGWRP